MGNLFSSGASEEECGTGDYVNMSWDSTNEKCVHTYTTCGADQVYDMSTSACRVPNSAKAPECDTCPPPAAPFSLSQLKVNSGLMDKITTCGNDNNGSFFDNTLAEGKKCVSCLTNQTVNKDDPMNPFCECPEGQEVVGDSCVDSCLTGQVRVDTDTGTSCVCPSGTKEVLEGGVLTGCKSNFTNPVTGKALTENEKLLLVAAVLVLLYVYRKQVQAMLNKGSRAVRRR